jgi:hypothetical protein
MQKYYMTDRVRQSNGALTNVFTLLERQGITYSGECWDPEATYPSGVVMITPDGRAFIAGDGGVGKGQCPGISELWEPLEIAEPEPPTKTALRSADFVKAAPAPDYLTNAQFDHCMRQIIKTINENITDPLTEMCRRLQARVDQLEKRGLDYRGVYQKACAYEKGDVVTFDGSMHCAVTAINPGEQPMQAPGWQLCVKAGRDAPEVRRPTNHSGNQRI